MIKYTYTSVEGYPLIKRREIIEEVIMTKQVGMKGWKTKLGAALTAFATAAGGLAVIAPIPEAKPWIIFIAALIGAVGLFFTVWGLGHKMEKAQDAVMVATSKPIPIAVPDPEGEIIKVTHEEFAALMRLRKKQLQRMKPVGPENTVVGEGGQRSG